MLRLLQRLRSTRRGRSYEQSSIADFESAGVTGEGPCCGQPRLEHDQIWRDGSRCPGTTTTTEASGKYCRERLGYATDAGAPTRTCDDGGWRHLAPRMLHRFTLYTACLTHQAPTPPPCLVQTEDYGKATSNLTRPRNQERRWTTSVPREGQGR